MPPPVLAYWNIRGMAQSIRFLLHYVNEEYEEKLYQVGPGPEFSREDWFKVKFNLGLAFPNLPYFVDGNVQLTESKAILRYIGRKHNLVGATAADMATVDMLLDVLADLDRKASNVFYSPEFEQLKEDLVKSSEAGLQGMETFVKGKTWLVGEKVSIADFQLYEYIARMVVFQASIIDKFSWLQEFVARFEALPAIKKYMASKDYIKRPFNNPNATWTGK